MRCSLEGCDGVARKRGWCGSHYAQWVKSGEVRPLEFTWRSEAGGPCDWCGTPVPADRGRSRFCRLSCTGNSRRVQGRPDVGCGRCGEQIDVAETGKAGRRKRSDVLMCADCRRAKYTRHGVSVTVLAQRDGTDCGICGDPVDMTVRMPDLMSASVDHIFPFSRGGSHDLSNLQLAHNICNRRKSARTPAAPTAQEVM